jgi:ribosomal protein S18 acetylase RimI-like enzyme
VRDAAVGAAKKAVARAAGADAWKTRVKPAAAWLGYKKERLGEMGLALALRTAASEAVERLHDRRIGLVYSMTPDQLQPAAPALNPAESFDVHSDAIEDLLLWSGTSPSTASLITQCARGYSRARAAGRSFHTILLNGRLAGWGYSYLPSEPAQLTETPGATLEFEAGATSLYDFHVLPEFRGRRLYQALLTEILRKRFAAGASRAYITVLESNTASKRAIERVGFRLMRRNVYRKDFRRQSVTTSPVQEP